MIVVVNLDETKEVKKGEGKEVWNPLKVNGEKRTHQNAKCQEEADNSNHEKHVTEILGENIIVLENKRNGDSDNGKK